MESPKPSDPYQFIVAGGDANSYFFTTVDDVVYELKFAPSSGYLNAYMDVDVAG